MLLLTMNYLRKYTKKSIQKCVKLTIVFVNAIKALKREINISLFLCELLFNYVDKKVTYSLDILAFSQFIHRKMSYSH